MARTCTVCGHAERDAIDRALVAAQSYRNIAQRYGLEHTAVFRHGQHISAALLRAKDAADVARGDSLLGQLRELAADARRIGERAEREGHLPTALQAVRELTRLLELQAKLAGELQQEGAISIHVNPQWLSVRAVLLEALVPYPEARAVVAGRLLALEGGQ